MTTIHPNSLLRLPQIIGQRAVTPADAEANRTAGKRGRRVRPEIPALVPVSAATWWAGVKSGRYPKPLKVGPRATVWRASEVLALQSPNP